MSEYRISEAKTTGFSVSALRFVRRDNHLGLSLDEVKELLQLLEEENCATVQSSILEHFGRRIEGVALKTGEGGVFTIRADGEQIYHNSQSLDLDRLVADLESCARV